MKINHSPLASLAPIFNCKPLFFFGDLRIKDQNKLNVSFVTRKKIGNAVKRNKIKRRLRSIINAAVKFKQIKLRYSYLVIAKPTMLNSEFKIIKETLFQEFNKIK